MNATEQVPVYAASAPTSNDAPGVGPPALPDYLLRHYAWAYLDTRNVQLLDRRVVLQTILFGNYRRLCDAALSALDPGAGDRVLQLGCAYGDLTPRLARRVTPGLMDVVDVAPQQLSQLRRKLPADDASRLHLQDACALRLPDAAYDRVLLFFLLHELPASHQRRALAEALRVCRPGGRVVVIDYARPAAMNPLGWLLAPLLTRLEPFLGSFWRRPVAKLVPAAFNGQITPERHWFGGLYRQVTLEP